MNSTIIVPPKIQVLMTGAFQLVKTAHQSKLLYTDGTVETVSNDKLQDVDWSDWFSIVGAIQKASRT